MSTNYDIWLYSNQGNGDTYDYCPHCNASNDNCICDEDYDLQQELTELNLQQSSSIEYMRGQNAQKGLG